MSQARRQLIADLVRDQEIHSQQELLDALASQGFKVSQATVSRDIRELALVRRPLPQGRSRYFLPGESSEARPREALVDSAIRQYALKSDVGNALLVLRTASGHANALAVVLDEASLTDVVATLAGDDTVLIVFRDEESRERMRARVEALLH